MQGRPSISGDVLTSPRLAPAIKPRARRQSDGRRRTRAQIADHAGYALPHEGTWPAWAGRLPQCHVGAHLVAVCVAALRTRGALVSFSAARATPRATSTSRAFRRLAVGPVLPERPYYAKEFLNVQKRAHPTVSCSRPDFDISSRLRGNTARKELHQEILRGIKYH